ncbi:MAG TPA: CPBP family intramembrane glutamic endopeptidase [Burkholderiales bacterium]|nr:CPBP family intramembrane glutamic endopeptidase [Burkholderiales bacterium]
MKQGLPAGARGRRGLEIAIFIVGFLATWSVRATVLYSVDEAIPSDSWRAVYSNFLKLIIWVMPAFGFVRWARQASPAQYLGLAVLPGVRQWILCLTATALYLCGVLAFESVLDGRSLRSLTSLAALGVSSIAVSSLLEEILFRGLVLRELREVFAEGGSANLLTSLLFLTVHLPHWLWQGGASSVLIANASGVFALSLFLGWLYFRSGSIWPPVTAHFAYNLLASLLVGHAG